MKHCLYLILLIFFVGCNNHRQKPSVKSGYFIKEYVHEESENVIDSSLWVSFGDNVKHYNYTMSGNNYYCIDVISNKDSVRLKHLRIDLDNATKASVCKMRDSANAFINKLNSLSNCK